jgi:hypothetical protein
MREISNTTVCCDYLVAMARPDNFKVWSLKRFRINKTCAFQV